MMIEYLELTKKENMLKIKDTKTSLYIARSIDQKVTYSFVQVKGLKMKI